MTYQRYLQEDTIKFELIGHSRASLGEKLTCY
jgi:hypothetical protein